MIQAYFSFPSRQFGRRALPCAFALALLALNPATAVATITISSGNTPGGDNLLFNSVGLINDALTVQGRVNGNLVNLTGTEFLHTNGGQARVEALTLIGEPADSYDYLALEMPGNRFTQLVWNLNTVDRAGSGSVTFTIDGVLYDGPDAGTAPDQFSIGNGGNFFTILADGASTIGKVEFQSTIQLTDTRQIRIGGISEADAPVPEPGTLLTLGLGLCGLSYFRRARS